MANAFDPYREALVVESVTVWPDEYDDLDADQRSRIEERLPSLKISRIKRRHVALLFSLNMV